MRSGFITGVIITALFPGIPALGEDGAAFAAAQAQKTQKEVDKLLSHDKTVASMRQLGLPSTGSSNSVAEGMKEQLEAIKNEATRIIDRGELPQGLNIKTGCPSQLFNKDGKASGNCSANSNIEKQETSDSSVADNENDVPAQGKKNQILVFVSFSMPEASLKSLAQDAVKHNATIVIRGLFEDSFVKTANKLQGLRISVDINPQLFEDYLVTAVPMFVAIENGQAVSSLGGNVTLGFAAKLLSQQAAPGSLTKEGPP